MNLAARNAKKIRAGLFYADLCRENALFIEHARYVLTGLGYEAWIRCMIRDGHSPVNGLPPI